MQGAHPARHDRRPRSDDPPRSQLDAVADRHRLGHREAARPRRRISSPSRRRSRTTTCRSSRPACRRWTSSTSTIRAWHTAERHAGHVSARSLQIVGDVVLAALPRNRETAAEEITSKRPVFGAASWIFSPVAVQAIAGHRTTEADFPRARRARYGVAISANLSSVSTVGDAFAFWKIRSHTARWPACRASRARRSRSTCPTSGRRRSPARGRPGWPGSRNRPRPSARDRLLRHALTTAAAWTPVAVRNASRPMTG